MASREAGGMQSGGAGTGGAGSDGAGSGGEAGLRYTVEHEWVRLLTDETVRVGITDYAAGQLGEVVFVDLPAEGDAVEAGRPMAEVESTKSVSEVFAPVTGTITAVNAALADAPEAINAAPFAEGWLVEIRASGAAALAEAAGAMMDADAYRSVTES